MNIPRTAQIAAMIALIVGYAVVRVSDLTASCLWFDEIFSVHAATQNWGDTLRFVALDVIHPPLFYLLLKIWIGIGGEGLIWVRLFPVVFSLLAIFPLIALCRELKLTLLTQLLAIFLVGVNGSLIKYSQEVRMYAPLMCLAIFSMWLFARYFHRGKSFVLLVVVNILLVYTHYFGWLVVVAEILLIVWFQRVKWRTILVMFSTVLVAFLPWLGAVAIAAGSGSDVGQNIGWMLRPGVKEIATFVLNVIEPFYFQTSTAEPVSQFVISLPLLILIATATVVFLLTREQDKSSIWFLLVFVKLPVIAAFVASWLLPYSVWGTRHLIVVFVPFCIYLASVLTSARTRTWRFGLISPMLVLTFAAGFLEISRSTSIQPWCGLEKVANEVISSDQTKNIYLTEDLTAYHTWFALREQGDIAINKLTNIDGMGEDKAYFLPRGFDEIKITNVTDVADDKFWIVYRGSSLKESEPPIRNITFRGYRVAKTKIEPVGRESVIAVLFEK